MVLPNFLIIGAAKAGTTALCDYLKQHPQIFISYIREPHFFAFQKEEINFRGPGDRKIHQHTITDFAEYQRSFKGSAGKVAIGEGSTTYLYSPQAPARIQATLPEVKLIAVLRNPVDRAYSSYLHLVRDGQEPLTDFAQALQAEATRIQEHWMPLWHYQQRGFYYQQLHRYYDLFRQEQIKIYLYEDLIQDPEGLLKDLFGFLEVDDTFAPDVFAKPNISGIPKNQLLHWFLTQPNPIKTLLRPLVPSQVRQNIHLSNLEKPQLSPETRQKMLEVYREDILQLQTLIQRDLSSWLQPVAAPARA
jgi:hypothetical protein